MNGFNDVIEVVNEKEIERCPMKQGRFSFGCGGSEGFIYVAGGNYSRNLVLNSVEEYSIKEDKW